MLMSLYDVTQLLAESFFEHSFESSFFGSTQEQDTRKLKVKAHKRSKQSVDH